MIILGVDPGRSGALAWLDTDTHELTVVDMPDEGVGVYNLLLEMPKARRAMIERIYPGQKQSKASVGQAHEQYGETKAAIKIHGTPLDVVAPKIWKEKLHVPADKAGARRRATEVFPDHSHLWKLVKHDGRAEAALIAWYTAQHKRING